MNRKTGQTAMDTLQEGRQVPTISEQKEKPCKLLKNTKIPPCIYTLNQIYKMKTIDTHINKVMFEIDEIIHQCNHYTEPTKLDKLTLDSAKILVKELHLCILRHTYRVDNIRHNYDTLEDLL